MSALRLGIAGCGRIAERAYLPALAGVPGLEVVAVADPGADRRRLLAERAEGLLGNRPAAHAHVAKLLDRSAPDALLVLTPPREHAAHAALASAAGITALVEKPPAPQAEGAAAMARLPHPPFIGFNRRFTGAAGLREALSGEAEVELALEFRYRRGAWTPVAVRDDAAGDIAPHLVDLALWLTAAEPVAVSAPELRERRARIELVTERGTATIACATDRPHLELVSATVAGRRQAWREGGTLRNALARARRTESALVASIREQLRAYEAALRGHPYGALATAADGLAAMRVIDAARDSQRAGGAPIALARFEEVAA